MIYAEGNTAQTVMGRVEQLSGVREHGMQLKLVYKRGRSQAAPETGYQPTSVTARELKGPLGSQMGRSTDEAG